MTVPWETVRVFISSTFEDMHAERDYLLKQVFPELREWCERRRLHLVDIDLRWGVMEQDTENKNVLDVCLNRIDQARPFFLCFLGQRRGWVPRRADISPTTQAEDAFPDLNEVVGKASVTEMEILHALVNPFHGSREKRDHASEYYDPVKYALFYLRDDSYLDQLPADFPPLWTIYTNAGIRDENERAEADRELQQWIHHRIPQACGQHARPCRGYSAQWDPAAASPELLLPLDCPSLFQENIRQWQRKWAEAGLELTGTSIAPADRAQAEEYNRRRSSGRLGGFECQGGPLSRVIIADLQAAILARFPDHEESIEITILDRELDQQEQFLAACLGGFFDRAGDFDELDAYVEGLSSQLFVLAGPAGSGKSTLLANWIDQQRSKLDHAAGQALHFRFIGQSDASTSVYSLLLLLLQEISPATNPFEQEILSDPQLLRQLFPKLLEAVGEKGRTVIVLDALNQLESGLADLAWLPYTLPKNIKLIVSLASDPPEAQALLGRMQGQVALSGVRPFDNLDHRRELVDRYLKQYLKQLDQPLLEALVNLPGAANPLYLKVVLSELRLFGAFANLAGKIRSEFGETPVSAFEAVLKRLENDPAYSSIQPGKAVPLLFGLLAHVRHGLSIQELAAIFTGVLHLDPGGTGLQAATDTLQLYLRQVRPFIANRSGRYDFFFASFKEAAQQRYTAPGDGEVPFCLASTQWHTLLADYFEALPTWQGDPLSHQRILTLRKVEELPYHLYQAGCRARLERLLSDPAFLEAKCEAGLVVELIQELESVSSLVGRDSSLMASYADFFRKHTQRLSRSRGLLPALLVCEGFPEAVEAIDALSENGPWTRPWLRTKEMKLSSTGQATREQAGLSIVSQWLFDPPFRYACLATAAGLAFYHLGRGQLGIVDLKLCREIDPVPWITPSAASPIIFLAAPDGRHVAVFLEDSSALLLKMEASTENTPRAALPVHSFSYLLPEYELPLALCTDALLVYQDPSGTVVRVEFESGAYETRPVYSPVQAAHPPELSAAVLSGDEGLLAFRNGRNSSLIFIHPDGSEEPLSSLPADITCACPLGQAGYAVATSDRKILLLSKISGTMQMQEILLEENAQKLLAQDIILYWLTRMGKLYRKELVGSKPAEVVVTDGDPSWYELPVQFELASPGLCSILTPLAALKCSFAGISKPPDRHLLAALVYKRPASQFELTYAIELRPDSLWVIDTKRQHEYPLITEDSQGFLHQYQFALDGNAQMLGLDLRGVLWDQVRAPEARRIPIPETGLSLAGNPSGGFFLAGQSGILYRMDQDGRLSQFNLGLQLTGQPILQCWPGLLAVHGTCLDASDYSSFLFLYQAQDDSQVNLNLVGRNLQHVDVLCALDFDPERNLLFIIYSRGNDNFIVVAPPQDRIAEKGTIHMLPEVNEAIRSVTLTPDGASLYLLSRSGNLFLVDTELFLLQAYFSGSAPFSSMSGKAYRDGSIVLIDKKMNLISCKKEGAFL
jgi:hypothetical protein